MILLPLGADVAAQRAYGVVGLTRSRLVRLCNPCRASGDAIGGRFVVSAVFQARLRIDILEKMTIAQI